MKRYFDRERIEVLPLSSRATSSTSSATSWSPSPSSPRSRPRRGETSRAPPRRSARRAPGAPGHPGLRRPLDQERPLAGPRPAHGGRLGHPLRDQRRRRHPRLGVRLPGPLGRGRQALRGRGAVRHLGGDGLLPQPRPRRRAPGGAWATASRSAR